MMTMQSNGSHVRGRTVPDWPTFTTSAGYVLRHRRVSPDAYPLMQQAAARELADSKPEIPIETVNTGPGTTAELPNPNNAAYLEAKAAWDAQVTGLAGKKGAAFLRDYAVIDETDLQAVAEYKAMATSLGIVIPETETDRDIWLWRVVCPSQQDMINLLGATIGKSMPSQEAIQAQKQTF